MLTLQKTSLWTYLTCIPLKVIGFFLRSLHKKPRGTAILDIKEIMTHQFAV